MLGDLEMEGLGGIGGLTLAEIFSSISSPEEQTVVFSVFPESSDSLLDDDLLELNSYAVGVKKTH